MCFLDSRWLLWSSSEFPLLHGAGEERGEGPSDPESLNRQKKLFTTEALRTRSSEHFEIRFFFVYSVDVRKNRSLEI